MSSLQERRKAVNELVLRNCISDIPEPDYMLILHALYNTTHVQRSRSYFICYVNYEKISRRLSELGSQKFLRKLENLRFFYDNRTICSPGEELKKYRFYKNVHSLSMFHM